MEGAKGTVCHPSFSHDVFDLGIERVHGWWLVIDDIRGDPLQRDFLRLRIGIEHEDVVLKGLERM